MSSEVLQTARATFARRLKALRVPRGYRTARSLAQRLEIDENRYTRYERAEVEPSLELLLQLCAALDVTPNDLLFEPASSTTHSNVEPGAGMSEADAAFMPATAASLRPAPAASLNPAPAASLHAGPASEPATPSHDQDRREADRRTTQWQLARFIERNHLCPVQATERNLLHWQATSQLFAAIWADPLAFIVALSADPNVAALAPGDAQELARLVDAVMAFVAPPTSPQVPQR